MKATGTEAKFLRATQRPLERTLIDIVRATAQRFPEAEAIDDGKVVVTYSDLVAEIDETAAWLYELGIRRGDRIGVRMPSGSRELYLAILAIMTAGAAYVPVDADDPDERAEMVFGEAGVVGYFDANGLHLMESRAHNRTAVGAGTNADAKVAGTGSSHSFAVRASEVISQAPTPDDDCWIIFTSGSTGKPKGVAVTHRSAAAFVDAEARWFLANHPEGPLGPDDRVLAGLSVAFDASCEEMWLAWRNGACLVPAPRSLVRSGVDLGPWLISRHITAVSTVPTLAGLWPAEALDSVRLLIVGGEACPQELVNRLATDEREMWNTYGPTEATVVASGVQLHPNTPVTIGFPLDGWDVAVVDEQDNPVPPGTKGELVIGGVGLARYLDPEKDAEKYAPLPALGWDRAYRTGDHVIMDEAGLHFAGRIDDQVKIGGRRIELGEVEAHLAALPEVTQTAVVVHSTDAGDVVLVGYVGVGGEGARLDYDDAMARLRSAMPAPMVPRLHIMDKLPVRTSGKVDKAALPWPLPARAGETDVDKLSPVERWLSGIWADVLAVSPPGADSDFFALGGTSLAAASVIARIRDRAPQVAVRDLYDHPRLGSLAEELVTRGFLTETIAAADSGSMDAEKPSSVETPVTEPLPVGKKTRWSQVALMIPLQWARGLRWATWLAIINWAIGGPLALPGWLVALTAVAFLTPLGIMPINALITRLLTKGLIPGDYPRGGSVHLRIWAAERLAESSGVRSVAGAPFVLWYARMLGAGIGRGVNLHALPPVTGLVTLGDYCSIEPEVDLSGYWVDGDVVHVGHVTVGKHARIGARSTLLPGARIGNGAHIEAGSTVSGEKKVKAGARWSGSPARKVGRSKHRFPEDIPPARRHWVAIYGLTAVILTLVPLTAAVSMTAVIGWGTGLIDDASVLSPTSLVGFWFVLCRALLWAIPATVVGIAVYALLTLILVRLFGLGLTPGVHPVRSRQGWQAWATIRLMDAARHDLFLVYASMLTPVWLRALGAQIGRDSEVSTVIGIPKFIQVKDESFLADDTMVGAYELGGGWLLAGESRIGKRAFLGNSGITLPRRKLAKNSLVAVLSSTPKKTKTGSNWWGSPPERMRRVSTVTSDESAQTYRPTTKLKIARGLVETLRVLAPMVSLMLAVFTLFSMQWIGVSVAPTHANALLLGLVLSWLFSPAVLLVAGVIGLLITVGVKWICVGKHRPSDHPLWSKFVWLNELQDAFIEMVAAPWYLNPAMATGGIARAMRLLGARVGHGVWLETYWLPETDLVTIERGATVGRGCVVQTHLFTDRVMTLDSVSIGKGAVIGPHSVCLPASALDDGCRVEPGSLVMRGDRVPGHTSWRGNPIEPVAS